eukprot:TRINITY_DN6727_c0_g2_i1.p1 TRINITY_DN6727_c0_g2~~TRINITY_DN6727_c0_g2_i1.p1  ORF type:complete len:237 (+),score=23.30 TRINITY_DN6727_c0_g2_i1:177-887(+)
MQSILGKAKSASSKLISAVTAPVSRLRQQRKWPGPFLHFRPGTAPWPEELQRTIEKDFVVLPEFLTQEEHDWLLEEVESSLQKRRYQADHFDKVISGYKETEKSFWNERNTATLNKVRNVFPRETVWLPAVHIIDLEANGPISAHVDHPDYSGGIISGLSLKSTSVMTLRSVKHPEQFEVDALLPPRSLYIMRRSARYDFSHAIPANQSVWRGEVIPRERRISIMFRDDRDNTAFG